MAPRPFVPYPHPCLEGVADPVSSVTSETLAIWDEMLGAMYAMPGVGLAAPQLGIGLRLAVLDCSDTQDQAVRLANPELIALAEEMRIGQEGSPNLPGLWEQVTRPAWAEVRYLDETGADVTRRFDDLWSASVQHQIDHLNGKLFFDHLSPLKRKRLLEKHRKAQRKRARNGA
ncbi:MAG: peptide deformylase [Pseudomonadota bacterium]